MRLAEGSRQTPNLICRLGEMAQADTTATPAHPVGRRGAGGDFLLTPAQSKLEVFEMKNLLELKQEHTAALDEAQACLGTKDHQMTAYEAVAYDAAMSRAKAISAQIKEREAQSNIRSMFPTGGILSDGGAPADFAGFGGGRADSPARNYVATRNPEYLHALVYRMCCCRLVNISGALKHGSRRAVGCSGPQIRLRASQTPMDLMGLQSESWMRIHGCQPGRWFACCAPTELTDRLNGCTVTSLPYCP
jgi:hypothetical protein